jgi:TPR repeat protein
MTAPMLKTAPRLVLMAALALPSAWAAAQGNPPANPISAPGTAWTFDGFAITVPDDAGWYSLAKDQNYADLARDYPDGLKVAVVVEAHRFDAGVAGEQDLLDLLRAEQTAVPEPGGMTLVEYTAEPFSPKGVLCARFSAKFDDRRANFPAAGVLLVRGVGCVRPDQSAVVVTVRCAQRGPLADFAPEVRRAADPLVASLRFLPSNTALMQQARMAARGDKPEEAVALLLPIAEEDSEAALFLGNIYLYGRGVAHDFRAARKWLDLAAKAGRAEAQYNIGAIYDKELGVARNVPEAIKWFTLAADQRDAQAQLNIALFHLRGDGVPKDIALAEAWLKRAAGNGNKRAQGILTVGKYRDGSSQPVPSPKTSK